MQQPDSQENQAGSSARADQPAFRNAAVTNAAANDPVLPKPSELMTMFGDRGLLQSAKSASDTVACGCPHGFTFPFFRANIIPCMRGTGTSVHSGPPIESLPNMRSYSASVRGRRSYITVSLLPVLMMRATFIGITGGFRVSAFLALR